MNACVTRETSKRLDCPTQLREQHVKPNPAASHSPVHWAVRMNHKNRSVNFVLVALVLGLHMAGQSLGPVAWVLLTLQFAIYPQLAYAVASRSKHPFQAEMRNMQFDALCFGAWSGGLMFPLWITFILLIACTVNLTLFGGARGVKQGFALFGVGALAAGAGQGFAIQAGTSPWATGLSIALVTGFLILISLENHRRSMLLHASKQSLRHNETVLTQQLQDIRDLHAQVRNQAIHDALTGLHNRWHLNEVIERDIARYAREGQKMSFLLIDIDHFKHVNDTYGHQVGDDVLSQTASLLAARARSSDFLCRYGGEEFLLVLHGADTTAAHAMAEDLRTTYAATGLVSRQHTIHKTLSIGLATFPADGSTSDALLQAADQALYRAKRNGRNRTQAAHDLRPGDMQTRQATSVTN